MKIRDLPRDEYNAYCRVKDAKYRAGQTWRDNLRQRQERREAARKIVQCLEPVASHETVGKMLGLSKQAVQQAEERIFWKIWQRMRDPNFDPKQYV